MTATLRLKRGSENDISAGSLTLGEPAFSTDTKRLFVSDGISKILVGRVNQGNLSQRPLPAFTGGLYWSQDTEQLFLETPSEWIEIASPRFNPSREVEIIEDWISNSYQGVLGWQRSINNGATANSTTTGLSAQHPSLIRLRTGANDSSRVTLSLGTSKVFLASGKMIVTICLYVQTLATGAEDYRFYVGLGDTTNDQEYVDGIYFEYDRANSANWICKSANNGTRTEVISSTLVQQGQWVKLSMTVDSATSQVDYYINESLAGSITTNIPTSTARICSPNIKLVKTSGSARRNIVLDYYYLRQIFTTAR